MVIVTLALGIGANTAVFSVVDGLLVRPLPYREPGQLGFLRTRLEWIGVPRAWMSGGHIAQLQREMTTIDDFVALRTLETQLTDAGDPEQIRVGFVTTNFTGALGVQPVAGRPFRPEDGLTASPRVILLGHALWVHRFGADPGVVGRRVGIGGQPHEIVGVMGPDFRFLSPSSLGRSPSPDAWVPGTWDFASMQTSPFSFALLVRVKTGKQLSDARAELDAIGGRLDRDQYGNKGFGVAVDWRARQPDGRYPAAPLARADRRAARVACRVGERRQPVSGPHRWAGARACASRGARSWPAPGSFGSWRWNRRCSRLRLRSRPSGWHISPSKP